MNITLRKFNHESDFDLLIKFLEKHYITDNKDLNWRASIWMFLKNHPCIENFHMDRTGIWEDDGNIVGVAHLESPFLGIVSFDIHPEYGFLKADMIKYAEEVFYGADGDRMFLRVFTRDSDYEFQEILQRKGYEKDNNHTLHLMKYSLETDIPEITTPEGFKVKTLLDECSIEKINRVLWRGFDYEGEPPKDKTNDLNKLHAWNQYQKETSVILEAQNGNIASFCSIWYEPVNKIGEIEPIVTDPDFRSMGLAKAAIYESMRRCKEMGATAVFVVPDNEAFYQAIGFKQVDSSHYWNKYFEQ